MPYRQRKKQVASSFVAGSASITPFCDSSFDLVLCHLALMVFRPLHQVLMEVGRILQPKGQFGAVTHALDGVCDPLYEDFSAMVQEHLARELPSFPSSGFCDPEMADLESFMKLLLEVFGNQSKIDKRDYCIRLSGAPETVAKDLLCFFYSAYLLDEGSRRLIHRDTVDLLNTRFSPREAVVELPHSIFVVQV